MQEALRVLGHDLAADDTHREIAEDLGVQNYHNGTMLYQPKTGATY